MSNHGHRGVPFSWSFRDKGPSRLPEDMPGKTYKCHGGDHSKWSNCYFFRGGTFIAALQAIPKKNISALVKFHFWAFSRRGPDPPTSFGNPQNIWGGEHFTGGWVFHVVKRNMCFFSRAKGAGLNIKATGNDISTARGTRPAISCPAGRPASLCWFRPAGRLGVCMSYVRPAGRLDSV